MAGNKPEQEPSIEEILASIRQIISDDDEPRAAGNIEIPKEEKLGIPVYTPEPPKEDLMRQSFADVLDLTNEIVEDEKSIDYSEEKFSIPLSQPAQTSESEQRNSGLDLSAMISQGRDSDLDLSYNDPAGRSSDLDLSASGDDIDALFSTPAADATTQAFSRLLGNIPVEREENKRLYADGRITLEDITKDLLRPMLRQWVDENVPKMVERLVEKELEKLSRQARD